MPWQGGDFPCVATGSAGNSQDDRIIHQQKKKQGLHVFQPPAKNFLVSPPANHGRCWPAKIAISRCQKNGDFNAQMLHVYPCILPLYHYLPTKLGDLWGKCWNICQHYGSHLGWISWFRPAPGAGWLGPGSSWQGAGWVSGFLAGWSPSHHRLKNATVAALNSYKWDYNDL